MSCHVMSCYVMLCYVMYVDVHKHIYIEVATSRGTRQGPGSVRRLAAGLSVGERMWRLDWRACSGEVVDPIGVSVNMCTVDSKPIPVRTLILYLYCTCIVSPS